MAQCYRNSGSLKNGMAAQAHRTSGSFAPRLFTQLLFTSHDVTTMKNTVFRRDEIWFAAEDDNHESEIYSLYEIRREDNERVNSTAAYDKQYLEGRYGADPYLANMLTGGEWK